MRILDIRKLALLGLLVCLVGCRTATPERAQSTQAPWTPEHAAAWQKTQPWLVGCNFIPSTAVNQLEMWQADTWDPKTIDRELGWAESLGFTTVRVFLHDLLWQQDSQGFLQRMDQFLDMAHRHRIGVMFVLFDGVWDPYPQLGKQREPRPYTHNSGWVQSPGADILKDPARQDALKAYVQGVVGHFREDPRVQVWDIFNEPDNPVPQYRKIELKNKKEVALQLLKKTFAWAREVQPTQPLTSGVWIGNWANEGKLTAMERCQLEDSDVISFHCYGKLDDVKACVQNLSRYQRPILCTEYMARPNGSHFDPNLGFFQQQHVAAYNWGFVNGKTQTIFPWDSWEKKYVAEPPVWFHDVFRNDGTPFDSQEVDYIKSVTRKAARN
jgi:hypothetical protein